MEATAFVLEVADGCWAAGIRDPGRSAKANPYNPPQAYRALLRVIASTTGGDDDADGRGLACHGRGHVDCFIA
jgi:hypothetical protein